MTEPLPPLNALRAFDAAGRHLSFAGAAQELRVTQGAVAQHVRGLETRLNLRLFDRHARGLHLTEAGRRYHAEVAEAFRRLEQATEALRPGAQGVTISVTPSLASKWLIPNMPDFTARHPDIDLRVMATEKLSQFRADGVDIVVRYGAPRALAGLEQRKLFDGAMMAVCAPDLPGHGLEGRSLLHDSLDLWPDFLEQVTGQRPAGRLPGPRFSQITLAIEAAQAGQGVALASRFMVARDLALGRLVPAVPGVLETRAGYWALCPREDLHSPARRIVYDWLCDAAGRSQKG
ncbi:LysR substrate-binding domain-containing protein [Maliponia aquimaris]|uniref:Glycine cleavage system transcriptional activator n=1 Tax=Maliponia aquimaris TaxID=1673631 RepID=A0A238KPD0_9RHOB|nr:LysR substrate-binding domain-containing protein [Maliponia aquimaris]SMX44714.1 Glycine cleavage system transcriptional activator [Maliponia aquimaris]